MDATGPDAETRALLARLRAFHFPGGEEAARAVRAVRIAERGETQSAPNARPVSFTSENDIDSTRSRFRWTARFKKGGITSFTVVDAYEEGHGRLAVQLGGLLPVRKFEGPDVDRGELQRYLGSITLCPPMLLNHPTLEFAAAGPGTLRVRDREDPIGASVLADLDEEGATKLIRADRPRLVGKAAILTPWSARGSELREWEGLRVATRLEAFWHLPEGTFRYYYSEVVSLDAVR